LDKVGILSVLSGLIKRTGSIAFCKSAHARNKKSPGYKAGLSFDRYLGDFGPIHRGISRDESCRRWLLLENAALLGSTTVTLLGSAASAFLGSATSTLLRGTAATLLGGAAVTLLAGTTLAAAIAAASVHQAREQRSAVMSALRAAVATLLSCSLLSGTTATLLASAALLSSTTATLLASAALLSSSTSTLLSGTTATLLAGTLLAGTATFLCCSTLLAGITTVFLRDTIVATEIHHAIEKLESVCV
jgi:hypothetical protein